MDYPIGAYEHYTDVLVDVHSHKIFPELSGVSLSTLFNPSMPHCLLSILPRQLKLAASRNAVLQYTSHCEISIAGERKLSAWGSDITSDAVRPVLVQLHWWYRGIKGYHCNIQKNHPT